MATEEKPGAASAKPGEPTTALGETKPGEVKPGEVKPGEVKPGETKPGEATPGDVKPGEQTPEQKAADAAKLAAEVPDKYEFTLPEKGPIHAAHVPLLEATAKGLGLTRAQAAKLVDVQVGLSRELTARLDARFTADPDLGGSNKAASTEAAQKGLAVVFAGAKVPQAEQEEILGFFRDGYGNHPGLIRMFKWLAQSVVEDTPAGGTGGSGKGDPVDPADKLYGKPKA